MLTISGSITKNSEKSDDEEIKEKIEDAYLSAKRFLDEGNNLKALELTEQTILGSEKNEFCYRHYELQGDIFSDLEKKTDDADIVKRVYLFASVDAYSMSVLLCPDAIRSFCGCVRSLIQLGHQFGMNMFYKKIVSKARRGLSITQPQGIYQPYDYFTNLKKELEMWLNYATNQSSDVATTVTETSTTANEMVLIKKDTSCRLKSFWANLDDKTKREFLVVDFRKLIAFIQDRYGNNVKEQFRNCVSILDIRKWRCWKYHICSQVNYCFTDCKMHILDNHVHNFEPKLSARPKYVDEVLADMISCGNWEPVDAVAAANLIIDRTKRGEEFVYVNGWCSDWPLAEDEERKNILKQIAEVLKSSCPKENCTLSCTLWEWLIDYTEENLKLPGVPGSFLDKCSFFQNPQSICFLNLCHLEHILKYFRQLTTDVRPSLVSTVVKRFWENSLVKERIDLEGVTTYNLLLDKRLLYEGEHEVDKIGTVETFKSTRIYEDVKPQGDKIVSWVLDCQEIDRIFVSQMGKGKHNFEIWLATLRKIQCMVRKKVSYYDKRHKMLTYEKILGKVETICDREDRRKNADLRSSYALALLMNCEEYVVKQDGDTKYFFIVVRDVIENQNSPRFEVLKDMECKFRLSTTVRDEVVKESILMLRSSLKEKLRLIDSKILLNESTYKKLINEFPKLSVIV